jgi:general secretion pathway protein G
MATIASEGILGIRARTITAVQRRKHAARDTPGGFTLVELLVVLAILGLVAAVAAPQVLKYLAKAKTDTARIDIKGIAVALDLFMLDTGHYPSEQDGLAVLVEKPRSGEWHGDYDLYTFGADNAPGGTGENQDVVNW